MLDSDTPAEGPATTPAPEDDTAAPARKAPAKKATTKKAAAKKATAKKATAKKATAKKTTSAKATTSDPGQPALPEPAQDSPDGAEAPAPAKKAAKKATTKKAAAKKATTKKATAKTAAKKATGDEPAAAAGAPAPGEEPAPPAAPAFAAPMFQAPDTAKAPAGRKKAAQKRAEAEDGDADATKPATKKASGKAGGAGQRAADAEPAEDADDGSGDAEEQGGRRRRRRGGRRRRKSGNGTDDQQDASGDAGEHDQKASDADGEGSGSASSRRRRRRRRAGEDGDGGGDDPENTVTRVRKSRSPEDEITAVSGSTRLEAKKQRRREGREAGRRRAPIVSEAEFLARREAVDRIMVIRQREDLTQIAVLEDKVLVEHYVARESQTSLIGNVYLGKVQNVLPSMEAAFIDIGKGRNAVLYAGEVNWDALGAGNGPRKIEQVLKSGQSVLVQVTKDPVGHKGARLTSQISLPGRFLVYVPDGTTSGISRKLPDTERNRLKSLLKEIVPDTAGVIVRTAAEGASEDELTRDVERLTARWDDLSAKVEKGGEKGGAAQLLYGEPDLTLKVVRDLFTEDFGKLVVSGDDAWDMVKEYVDHVAPDLGDRLERYDEGRDAFAAYRIDEQIAKALDRKVWLPSGGSLIIDRTEAMTVVDVNTGKFTGSGGNLEETVTKNNLEAAEEIVRQLRLRDIGGIIVVDFIDMVLESNRDLVLRRMVECLGRDRTRHQVAEVTSLGLVQMTRKRIGTGLLEAFSEACEQCQGRGLLVHHEPVEPKRKADDEPRRGRRGRTRASGDGEHGSGGNGSGHGPSPKEFAAMAGKPADSKEPAESKEPVESKESKEPAESKEPVESKDLVEPKQPVEPQEPVAATAGTAEADADEAGTAEVETPPAPPAPPTVVTSTRRRVARRPAGPPSGGSTPGAGSVDGVGSVDGAGPGSEDEPATASASSAASSAGHVPVKRKGSRKR